MTNRRGQRRPRVLYLAFYFPPSRASGVYRARATANFLTDQGWDVTVLASPLKFLHEVIGSVDEGLAATVDPRIRVERPAQHQFVWERDIRRFSPMRRNLPLLTRKIYTAAHDRIFPEHYYSWGLNAVSRALRMHARRRFDIVLATGNPFVSFAAAWMFNRMTGVPYVADYRDAWTLNLFTDAPAFPPEHQAWKWERRVLSRASASCYVNDALRGWHAERYPSVANRMMVIPNGWDPDLMAEIGEPPALEPAGEPRPLQFSYLGTLTHAQPVEEMVTAFQRARIHPEMAGAQLNIHGHLGFFAHGQSDIAEKLGVNLEEQRAGSTDAVVYRGPVSKTDVGQVYEQSDVLVFLAGGARYVTSGKIFEYMAAGRPIVSVHAPGIAATEVLDGYPLWFNANSLDPDEVAQTMVAAAKAARDIEPEQRRQAKEHARRYRRETVLAPLEERLRAVVERPRAAK
ncbi:glycosyltransferase [Catellatospora citrea]|uniref:glycosyltransferase n=1 Tax=Catellatospora citrea TaxID=53366 RepID=UPI00340A3D3C